MKRIFPVVVTFLVVVMMAAFAIGDSHKGTKMDVEIDLEAAKATFEGYCGKCHDLDRALGKKKDKDGWEKTVERMSGYHKRFGNRIPEEDEDAIIEYLVREAGK
jgi:hypothetical protein